MDRWMEYIHRLEGVTSPQAIRKDFTKKIKNICWDFKHSLAHLVNFVEG